MATDPLDPLGMSKYADKVAKSVGESAANAADKSLFTRKMGAKLAKGQKDKVANEVLGPCIVNVGSPRINRVRIEPPQNKPTDDGSSSYQHHIMHLFNKGRILNEYIGRIGIFDHRDPYETNVVTDMVNSLEPHLKDQGYRYVETIEKSIDNKEGAITVGQGAPTLPDTVSFQYILDKFTRVSGFLMVSYKDALEILESVRVKFKEERALNRSKPSGEMNPVVSSSAMDSPTQKLKQLKELLDQGFMTESEYESKRQEILSRL